MWCGRNGVNGERCFGGNTIISIVMCFESCTIGEMVGVGYECVVRLLDA
jgi:hypothetical protein